MVNATQDADVVMIENDGQNWVESKADENVVYEHPTQVSFTFSTAHRLVSNSRRSTSLLPSITVLPPFQNPKFIATSFLPSPLPNPLLPTST